MYMVFYASFPRLCRMPGSHDMLIVVITHLKFFGRAPPANLQTGAVDLTMSLNQRK